LPIRPGFPCILRSTSFIKTTQQRQPTFSNGSRRHFAGSRSTRSRDDGSPNIRNCHTANYWYRRTDFFIASTEKLYSLLLYGTPHRFQQSQGNRRASNHRLKLTAALPKIPEAPQLIWVDRSSVKFGVCVFALCSCTSFCGGTGQGDHDDDHADMRGLWFSPHDNDPSGAASFLAREFVAGTDRQAAPRVLLHRPSSPFPPQKPVSRGRSIDVAIIVLVQAPI
jgi:hypothetical protein